MVNLYVPGRHHIVTNFQFNYLHKLVKIGKEETLKNELDVNGNKIGLEEKVDNIIFGVTSANHSNTRRNPLPMHLRAMMINDFSRDLDVPVYVYGIDDIKSTQKFADYCIKKIENQSEGQFVLNPENTIVVCSTPVLKMYEEMGFKVLPLELDKINNDIKKWSYKTPLAWEIVEAIAKDKNWKLNELFLTHTHPAAQRIYENYKLGDKIQLLFSDDIIGNDGDITETRDYNSYVRQMDDNAEGKADETLPFVKPGRIGDIGCAVGSWIKKIAKEHNESDFYGVEVSRKLFDLCHQRKENGEFGTDYVFFIRKNAVLGNVFLKNSMNTIHTSSLTHEIFSYVGKSDVEKAMQENKNLSLYDAHVTVGKQHLEQFVKNRFEETKNGGAWINRDVVGPKDKYRETYFELNTKDGKLIEPVEFDGDKERFQSILERMSTFSRFLQFAKDFRHEEGYTLNHNFETIGNKNYVVCSLKDGYEFMTRKDYTDNWQSEMHEEFGFFDFNEWKQLITNAGFKINSGSYAFNNPWIRHNRWEGKVGMYESKNGILVPIDYPITTMILVGEKQ